MPNPDKLPAYRSAATDLLASIHAMCAKARALDAASREWDPDGGSEDPHVIALGMMALEELRAIAREMPGMREILGFAAADQAAVLASQDTTLSAKE